jgi:hypothetical protein
MRHSGEAVLFRSPGYSPPNTPLRNRTPVVVSHLGPTPSRARSQSTELESRPRPRANKPERKPAAQYSELGIDEEEEEEEEERPEPNPKAAGAALRGIAGVLDDLNDEEDLLDDLPGNKAKPAAKGRGGAADALDFDVEEEDGPVRQAPRAGSDSDDLDGEFAA